MKTILLTALLALTPFAFAQEAAENPMLKEITSKLTNPKKKFTLIVKVTVKEGEAEKFIAAFAEAIEPTRKEEGCSRYELNQVAGEPNKFVIYERWAKLERMAAHLETAHTKKLLATVGPMFEGAPEITVLTPQAEPVKPKPAPAP